ncbi:MAG: hypothetical protein IPG99_05735 [Ignavibacteria bacterium]|nr:hypothetical protein [Ignavibacteria bacterium]
MKMFLLMRGIPNINVLCPADEEDMLIGLRKSPAKSGSSFISDTIM